MTVLICDRCKTPCDEDDEGRRNRSFAMVFVMDGDSVPGPDPRFRTAADLCGKCRTLAMGALTDYWIKIMNPPKGE